MAAQDDLSGVGHLHVDAVYCEEVLILHALIGSGLAERPIIRARLVVPHVRQGSFVKSTEDGQLIRAHLEGAHVEAWLGHL